MTTVSSRRTQGTDHESFDLIGIPGFQFIQDPRDYEPRSVHTNEDVYERLNPADMKQAAVIEAIFVYKHGDAGSDVAAQAAAHGGHLRGAQCSAQRRNAKVGGVGYPACGF